MATTKILFREVLFVRCMAPSDSSDSSLQPLLKQATADEAAAEAVAADEPLGAERSFGGHRGVGWLSGRKHNGFTEACSRA